MKNILSISILLIAIISGCGTAKKTATVFPPDNNGKPMLLGTLPESALQQPPFKEWYEKNYSGYQPNDSIGSAIQPLLSGKKIKIFLGTWCGDSKREVPKMMKALHHYGIPSKNIQLVFVDNHDSSYKQSPAHEERQLNIHRVPTFIVYDGNAEMGRIVETPHESLEKDLLKIVSGHEYTPKYKGVVFMNNLFKIMPSDSLENAIGPIGSLAKPLLKHAGELNSYGYVLMAAGHMKEAGFTFRLNALIYPNNANVFDSLGEYFLKAGNKLAAKENYQKVLLLDPKNENAKKMLESF